MFSLTHRASLSLLALTIAYYTGYHTGQTTQTSSALHKTLSEAEKNRTYSAISRKDMLLYQKQRLDETQMTISPKFTSPFTIFDYVRPTFSCPYNLERIGGIGDGGKWVCGMSVADDALFERAILQLTNALVWGYDPTVSGWPKHIDSTSSSWANFTQATIGPVKDSLLVPPVFTIKDAMVINGYTFIDILKIDIEGAEFDVLSSLSSFVEAKNKSLPIGQMLMEIHHVLERYRSISTI